MTRQPCACQPGEHCVGQLPAPFDLGSRYCKIAEHDALLKENESLWVTVRTLEHTPTVLALAESVEDLKAGRIVPFEEVDPELAAKWKREAEQQQEKAEAFDHMEDLKTWTACSFWRDETGKISLTYKRGKEVKRFKGITLLEAVQQAMASEESGEGKA